MTASEIAIEYKTPLPVMRTLVETLETLIGAEVSEVLVGAPCGSMFYLFFHKHDVDIAIDVHCAWRLDGIESVLTGWNEDNSVPHGTMTTSMKALLHRRVVGIEHSRFHDLSIFFDDETSLRIFCDRTPNEDVDGGIENYNVADQLTSTVYCVNNLCEVVVEPYS
jgi:hypothetical protein